jgi:hypothetical protein
VYIARADEFEQGGGDPEHVGETSFKSDNGGESWKQSPFGPLGNTKAEYTVRISLDRYKREGWLASPVIDLWRGDDENLLVPLRNLNSTTITLETDVPEGTQVEYYLRKGFSIDPFADDWGEYEFIGSGERLNYPMDQQSQNRRYIQLRAVLTTTNPLISPVVRSLRVKSGMRELVPLHDNIIIVEENNPDIKYSSIDWEWERWDRPEFAELRTLENLDEVVLGSRTDLEAQVRLLDYVTKRWRHMSPMPEYPGWDAISILKRV